MPTFTVRGHKVRTASPRRYIVVSTYRVPPTVVERTNNLEVARAERRRDGVNRLILDARTGEVVG